MKKITILFLGIIMILNSMVVCKNKNSQIEDDKNTIVTESNNYTLGFDNTTATDDYGRTFYPVDNYDTNKFVGLFYFLWNGDANRSEIYDISNYQKKNKVLDTLTNTPSRPAFHYWGEPLYGYYCAEDEWVIRKHIELFINAGLDFITFDTTNNLIYKKRAEAVLNIILEYYNKGYKVPKAMFMTNTNSAECVENIYNSFYKNGKYDKIWFVGKGEKPWILGDVPENEEIKNYFYFKKAQWPNEKISENNFPWISWNYPQEKYNDKTIGNILSVSVSQHIGVSKGINFSESGVFAPYNRSCIDKTDYNGSLTYDEIYNSNWGRGYSHNKNKNDYALVDKNINFEEQWNTVKNNDISLVFVTGWNEWVAQRQPGSVVLGDSYGHFVDTFNEEFSRDIEMSKDGYLDNCFLQLVRNIRLFKGLKYQEGTKYSEINENKDMFLLSNWNDVKAVYKCITGNTLHRDSYDATGSINYINNTGRNDLSEIRVASNNNDIYFLIKTENNITEKAKDDCHWMNLFIGMNENDGFIGLQYVLNRNVKDGKSILMKITESSFEPLTECEMKVTGQYMILKIRKSDINLQGDEYSIAFKVADNYQKDFDVADLYVNGDVAPLGRIKYVYSVCKK